MTKTLGAQIDLFGGEEVIMDSLLAASQLALRSLDAVIVIDSQGFAHHDQVLVPPAKDQRGVYMVRLLSIAKNVRLFRVFSARRLHDNVNVVIV